MNIKPIRTKANYRAALKNMDSLIAAKADTPEGIVWMSGRSQERQSGFSPTSR